MATVSVSRVGTVETREPVGKRCRTRQPQVIPHVIPFVKQINTARKDSCVLMVAMVY